VVGRLVAHAWLNVVVNGERDGGAGLAQALRDRPGAARPRGLQPLRESVRRPASGGDGRPADADLVLDAGPDRATSLHAVGGQFDSVYAEGSLPAAAGRRRQPDTGARTGPGGFIELSFPEAGDYPFVSHVMVDAERSAHGIIEVGDR
jgi:hypothetical protein